VPVKQMERDEKGVRNERRGREQIERGRHIRREWSVGPQKGEVEALGGAHLS
jgi:hypothetical protein